jgi:hypothetical protein
MSIRQTATNGNVNEKNKEQLEYAVACINEVTGLNLELESSLSWKDGKTILYDVINRKRGYVVSYSSTTNAKQLFKELNTMYIFARNLRSEGKLNKDGVSQ